MWEEYKRMPHGNPYVCTLFLQKGGLVYYGVIHTIDPENPQISAIEEMWNSFKPDLAFCEGCLWPYEKNRKEAVRRYGEQGFLRFLAERDNVPIKCIDPPNKLQVRYLKQYFNSEQIKVYYVFLHTLVKKRMGRALDDKTFVDSILRQLSRHMKFYDFPDSLDDFEWAAKKLFPELSDWRDVHYTYLYCPSTGKYLPEVHRRLRHYRNLYQVNYLISELKKGKKVFAVVGRSHVIMQEPVIHKSFR